MSKPKMFLLTLVALMMTAVALAACGDPTATNAPAATAAQSAAKTTTASGATTAATTGGSVPTPAGASAISLPDMLKSQVGPYLSSVPNGVFSSYKFGDQPAKAKSAIADSFKKDGWDDKSAMMGQAAGTMEAQGIFLLLFQKGGKMAQVIGYPGSIAKPMGASIGDSETFYIVVSGGQ